MKSDLYTILVDTPGQREIKHYVNTAQSAYKLAKTYLLMKGTVTIYDANGKMIYRHAKPYTRQTYQERLCMT